MGMAAGQIRYTFVATAWSFTHASAHLGIQPGDAQVAVWHLSIGQAAGGQSICNDWSVRDANSISDASAHCATGHFISKSRPRRVDHVGRPEGGARRRGGAPESNVLILPSGPDTAKRTPVLLKAQLSPASSWPGSIAPDCLPEVLRALLRHHALPRVSTSVGATRLQLQVEDELLPSYQLELRKQSARVERRRTGVISGGATRLSLSPLKRREVSHARHLGKKYAPLL
jgi:hypothetical protein